jgi:hypothetical protein
MDKKDNVSIGLGYESVRALGIQACSNSFVGFEKNDETNI